MTVSIGKKSGLDTKLDELGDDRGNAIVRGIISGSTKITLDISAPYPQLVARSCSSMHRFSIDMNAGCHFPKKTQAKRAVWRDARKGRLVLV